MCIRKRYRRADFWSTTHRAIDMLTMSHLQNFTQNRFPSQNLTQNRVTPLISPKTGSHPQNLEFTAPSSFSMARWGIARSAPCIWVGGMCTCSHLPLSRHTTEKAWALTSGRTSPTPSQGSLSFAHPDGQSEQTSQRRGRDRTTEVVNPGSAVFSALDHYTS